MEKRKGWRAVLRASVWVCVRRSKLALTLWWTLSDRVFTRARASSPMFAMRTPKLHNPVEPPSTFAVAATAADTRIQSKYTLRIKLTQKSFCKWFKRVANSQGHTRQVALRTWHEMNFAKKKVEHPLKIPILNKGTFSEVGVWVWNGHFILSCFIWTLSNFYRTNNPPDDSGAFCNLF